MDGLVKKAAGIMRRILYMNIASITPEGKPWNSPVYCAFDRNLNYYWLSWKLNQHSKNIRNNPSVFVTVYDSTVPASTGFGVYLEGEARELNNPVEILSGLRLIYGREKRKPRDVVQFLRKFPRRAYKFVPRRAWINGDGEIDGNYVDTRTELDLKGLKEALSKAL
jgi:hypothetical protein